jgi:hypothetical protein
VQVRDCVPVPFHHVADEPRVRLEGRSALGGLLGFAQHHHRLFE